MTWYELDKDRKILRPVKITLHYVTSQKCKALFSFVLSKRFIPKKLEFPLLLKRNLDFKC